ncbi:hypothetical protein L249_8421 [Ophiocordyceps polyrhachis-furcata BCC 54312]|uniref:Uncharacterized protein n=1 Tax=Ophiocordyceps polyrhachis-furcata BCC 54312 TaxID=1330021 RepID=A0A367L642_9HYPO|nr:hypothetical protein L249_8421 [Ophiocordyceps polyrhachis-furcata BCC 54312]
MDIYRCGSMDVTVQARALGPYSLHFDRDFQQMNGARCQGRRAFFFSSSFFLFILDPWWDCDSLKPETKHLGAWGTCCIFWCGFTIQGLNGHGKEKPLADAVHWVETMAELFLELD